MDKVSILKVRDKDEDQEALVIVRSVNGFVALTLSLEHGADVQVVLAPSECEELISLLQDAAAGNEPVRPFAEVVQEMRAAGEIDVQVD